MPGAEIRAVRAGVLAAGRGDRLRHRTHTLKPLVPVAGRTLVEHVLCSLAETAPAEVVVIVNEASLAVRDHVMKARQWPFALRWIVETTPSSMHSFLRVVETLAGDGAAGPFLISTVDTIAAPGAFAAFASASRELEADLTLAVTAQTDDEKPLLVELDEDGVRVKAIGDTVRRTPGTRPGELVDGIPERVWATAGYYAVRPSVLQEADEARRHGVGALRAFFGRLLVRGYRLGAVPVAGGVDVDRPADIRAAEAFLKEVAASCG